MDAIEKIMHQIEQQAKKERAVYESAERQRIDEQTARERSQLEKMQTQKIAQTKQNLEKKYRQLQNRQQVAIRQQMLVEKQQFLTQLFQTAADQMGTWPAREQQNFAKTVLTTLAIEQSAEFVIGLSSTKVFTAEWLQNVNEQLPYHVTLVIQESLKEPGFIVNDRGILYNFVYQTIVADLQPELSYQLAQKLFD
jgi:V/A-type H+-transporting ATPase subunit E